MKDLNEFTAVYVNPKLRKMRMEAYAMVATYLVEFPKVEHACLKCAWKQNTSKGWCQVPPSISHILSIDSKFGMYDFIFQVEMAMGFLSKTASTVVEELRPRRN